MSPRLTQSEIYLKKKYIAHQAIPIFDKYGFEKTKIYDIAKRAKISTGAIYLYFNSKDDILMFIFEETARDINERIVHALKPEVDSSERIQATLDIIIDFFSTQYNLARTLLQETYTYTKKLRGHGREVSTFVSHFDEILTQAKEEGRFKHGISTQALKYALYGTLEQTLYGLHIGNPATKVEVYTGEDIKKLMHIILNAFMEPKEIQSKHIDELINSQS